MARKKITDKFDAYINFLEALISNMQRSKREHDAKIALYIYIKDILYKKRTGKIVTDDEYGKLIDACCPELDLLEMFKGNAEITAEGITTPDLDRLLWSCPNTDCISCWQNFINIISECINTSELITKNAKPLDESLALRKDDGNLEGLTIDEYIDLLTIDPKEPDET